MSVPIACPDTFECTGSTITPSICLDGQYCSTADPTTQSGDSGYPDPRDASGATLMPLKTCPTGYFCKKGRKFGCYSGYVCSVNSITPTPKDGQGGYVCPKGYYCPLK